MNKMHKVIPDKGIGISSTSILRM